MHMELLPPRTFLGACYYNKWKWKEGTQQRNWSYKKYYAPPPPRIFFFLNFLKIFFILFNFFCLSRFFFWGGGGCPTLTFKSDATCLSCKTHFHFVVNVYKLLVQIVEISSSLYSTDFHSEQNCANHFSCLINCCRCSFFLK